MIVNITSVADNSVVAIVDGNVISDRIYKVGTPDPMSGRIKAWKRFTGEQTMLHPSLKVVDVSEEAKKEGWRF